MQHVQDFHQLKPCDARGHVIFARQDYDLVMQLLLSVLRLPAVSTSRNMEKHMCRLPRMSQPGDWRAHRAV